MVGMVAEISIEKFIPNLKLNEYFATFLYYTNEPRSLGGLNTQDVLTVRPLPCDLP